MDVISVNKREKEFKWEWFRHSEWFNYDVRENVPSLFTQAATRILKEAAADNCLEFLCGFGKTARQIYDQQLNVIGFDYSPTAIEGARNLALQMKKNIPYFPGSQHEKLVDILPHKFKSVVSKDIMFETDWHNLKNVFCQIFEALSSGGIFVFAGADNRTNFGSDIIACYDKKEDETLLWTFRDGRLSCSKLMIKGKSTSDYRDYKFLYVIEEGSESRLEVVEKRLPGYWNQQIIEELVYDAGFCHFETRKIESDGSRLILNIAYKEGNLTQEQHSYSEEEAYYDF